MVTTAPARPVTQLVVVGSSAGGIEALSTLVASLPAEFPAPIVVAQHLDPGRPSHLESILGRRTPLAVRTVTDQEPLRAGVLYLVPSNRHVAISDSHVAVQQDDRGRPIPSVDLLLRSAAQAFGEQLVAVILSGTGSDGAAGARAVKQAGGTVVSQNPDTAAYPGMPLSLAPTTVDIVANLEQIGPILRDLLAGVRVPTRPDEQRLVQHFLEELRQRFGVDFTNYKPGTIGRRLQRRIVATRSRDLAAYIDYARAHPQERQLLINSLLIKVTEFFRDPAFFAYLREAVLPELVARARARGDELRIWSAGCATGEEAYSLAILVAEALAGVPEQLNARIFATDLDAEAIEFARRGIYSAAAVEHVPEELVARHFTREDNTYQVRKPVRSLLVFGQHDLVQRAPFPNVDLVVCRNVLIYFTPELQQRTLRLFAYALRDGGYLALGKAETVAAAPEYYAPEQPQHRVYRRQGDRILIPPVSPYRLATTAPQHRAPRAEGPRRPAGYSEPFSGQRLLAAAQAAQAAQGPSERLLHQLTVGIVVVDRRYDVLAINSTARRALSIHRSAVGEDLLHIAQGVPYAVLRGAIDAAFREGTTVNLDEVAAEDLVGGERYLQVTCHPQRGEDKRAPVESVMLVINDVTQQVAARRDRAAQEGQATEPEAAATESPEREAAFRRLIEANRQLLEANQELTSANEELRATNEELRATNEEFLLGTEAAQAAAEEVETLNEELQASNEELETLNEELQATIEELNTTNDDLHARSAEMERMAEASEAERGRLEAILVSMADAVLVVDRAGRPVRANAAYAAMFGDAGTELVLQDADGRELPVEATPWRRAARGESFSMEFTLAGEGRQDGARRWFEANVRPIPGNGGGGTGGQGGVVVIRDITERSLQRLQEEFMALASHELRGPLTPLQSYLQLLVRQLRDQPAGAPPRQYAELALRQVGRLRRLADDLLDVTRLQSGRYSLQPAPVRLDELAAQAVELAQTVAAEQAEQRAQRGQAGQGVPRIELEGADVPLLVRGDEGRLEQVLLNLLTNALTHAPDTERIEVRLRRDGGPAGQAEVQVRDDGPGIPAADLPHVFSRFYQVARSDRPPRSGLGLGLYIASEIVTAHGGTLAVASVEGRGTTFTVRLPLLRDGE